MLVQDDAFRIPAGAVDEAFDRLVAMNRHHELKWHGGTREPRPVGSESIGLSPEYRFTRLAWDYDLKVRDAAEVLRELGFDVAVEPDGSLLVDGFAHGGDSQYDAVAFCSSISDLVEPCEVRWHDDWEGTEWSWEFDGTHGMLEGIRVRRGVGMAEV